MHPRRTISGRAVATAVVLLVGAGLLAGASVTDGWASRVMSEVALVMLVVGVLAAIYQAFIEPDIAELLEVRTTHRTMGLRSAAVDAGQYDYTELFESSRRLVVLLNDGRTWCSHHREKFRKRFEDSRLETTVLLIHPESPMIDVLARKGDTNPQHIRDHIAETIQVLEGIRGDGHLEILGHFLFNPHSVILGDDRAVVVPYFASRGGRLVPAFEYRDAGKDSYFRELVEDLEQLRVDASLIDVDGRPAHPRSSEARRRDHLPRSRAGRLRFEARLREASEDGH